MTYCKFKGRECKFFKDRYGKFVISTQDIDIIDNTFAKIEYQDNEVYYRKEVTPDEIGEVYQVKPYAIYKGEEFRIFGCDNIIFYLIPTRDEQIKKFNMRERDRGEYELQIPMEDVVVFEKIKYFDKEKFFDGKGYEYYREERVIIDHPEW